MTKLRISGGRLITENGILEKDLLISGGKIEAIIDRPCPSGEDYVRLECEGNYVSAGFVDIHQHGGGGSDYMDGSSEAFKCAANAHIAHGTTSIMPTLLSAEKDALINAIAAYKNAKKDKGIKAELIGLHIEGPYLAPAHAGAQKPERIRSFDKAEYTEIANAADGNIARWSVAPEVSGAEAFAEFARSNGITLSIAHSNADLDTVLWAYERGFRHITHLYSCMSTITRRAGFRVPGVLEAAFLIDDMNVEIIADGCHIPHSLLKYVTKFKKLERIALITDSMRAAAQNVTESFLGHRDDPLPVIIEDGVAKLCDRSAFGGSVATADRLIRNMIKAGSSLPDAVKMMTSNPIEMMGLDLKKGRLCTGYDADICIFDKDINVKKVLVGGEIAVE